MKLNLENVKTGDFVTVIRGGRVRPSLAKVSEWSETHKRFRLANLEGKNLGLLPPNGEGRDFMSKRQEPDFFYSANPAHVRQARRLIERNKRQAEKAAALKAAKLAILSPFLEEYRDSEECYTLSHLDPDTIVNRLSTRQLKTFARWMAND